MFYTWSPVTTQEIISNQPRGLSLWRCPKLRFQDVIYMLGILLKVEIDESHPRTDYTSIGIDQPQVDDGNVKTVLND
jgi:hypothetical protein